MSPGDILESMKPHPHLGSPDSDSRKDPITTEEFLPYPLRLRACHLAKSTLYSKSRKAFSVNGQIVNIPGSVGYKPSVAATQLCCWSRETATDSM